MKQINILCIPPDLSGTGYFRFIEPHLEICKQFKDEFHIDINLSPEWTNKTYLSKFQIIFGSTRMLDIEEAKIILPVLQKQGIIIIIDTDDHYDISENPKYDLIQQTEFWNTEIGYFSIVDYIVTTTDFFANQIQKHNKNVVVFPNAIDPTAEKFKINKEKSDKIRLGYIGGPTHLEDVKLLKGLFNEIATKYVSKTQIILCGFHIGNITYERDQNGNYIKKLISIEETSSYQFEKIMTANYRNLSPAYRQWLLKFKDEEYPDASKLPYRRIWWQSIDTYSQCYNLFDISLIPLIDNNFNSAKSQLKIIEAGFFKKAIIASAVSPYQIDIINGKNGFLVKEGEKEDWLFYAEKLFNHPNLMEEIGGQLHETVKYKYDLRNVSRHRAEFYRTITTKG